MVYGQRMTGTKRPYDARRRRQRAEQERDATRRRVVEAARTLFLERGYVATTMADIARTAGVALQSVYGSAASKAALLHLVADLLVAGDDQDVLLLERPRFRAVADEPSPQRQIELIATVIVDTLERLAPLWVAYREAAAVDAKAAANLAAAHRRRLDTFRGLIRMVPEHQLRRSHEDSADAAWAIGSVDVFLLMRTVLEWDADRYATWLHHTLHDQLLAPISCPADELTS